MKTDLQSLQDKADVDRRTAFVDDGFHRLAWSHWKVADIAAQWDRLASCAQSPNPFFERWFLIPSLEAFDPDGAVELGILTEGGKLRGLIPLFESRSYHGRPLPHRTAWLHANMFCGIPLVEPGFEQMFWSSCLDALDRANGPAWFFHLRHIPTNDAVTAALRSTCRLSGRKLRGVLHTERALLCSDDDPQTYLASSMTTKARKELRRQRKRLGENGKLQWTRSRDSAGIEDWIDDFLALERKGWKGDARSALADDRRSAVMFRQALLGSAQRGRLERLALNLDGRPIAMLATFLSPPASFAFKTAFDEDFSRFSPGLQLQVENLELLNDPEIDWCDSCAEPGHSMIERIWSERRQLAYFSVPIGHGWRRWAGNCWTKIEEFRQRRPT